MNQPIKGLNPPQAAVLGEDDAAFRRFVLGKGTESGPQLRNGMFPAPAQDKL